MAFEHDPITGDAYSTIEHEGILANVWAETTHENKPGERIVLSRLDEESSLPLCTDVIVRIEEKGFDATLTEPYEPQDYSELPVKAGEIGRVAVSFGYRSKHEVNQETRHTIICMMARIVLDQAGEEL